jgi:hypothetical protein
MKVKESSMLDEPTWWSFFSPCQILTEKESHIWNLRPEPHLRDQKLRLASRG